MPGSWYDELFRIYAATESPDTVAKRRETLLRYFSMPYRDEYPSDHSAAFLAMFENELVRLFQAVRSRIDDEDERRGLVTACFLQAVANAWGGELAASEIIAETRRAVFREIRRADNARRRERPADFQSDAWGWLGCCPEPDDTADIFAERRRRLVRAMAALPAMERAAIEATCLHDLSERAAAEKLGISRSALNRLLARAKPAIAREVGLPLPEPGKARSGRGARGRGKK